MMPSAHHERLKPTKAHARVTNLPWAQVAEQLDAQGCAVVTGLLDRSECEQLIGLYDRADLFRSRVVMAKHNFGRGEYQYLAYPLPAIVQTLRDALYGELASVANRWQVAFGADVLFPHIHSEYLARCHEGGQTKPTPLLLKYEPGDFNCLHQDLYGSHIFPLQVAVLLSEPGRDFTGGEFVMTEQRPRMQSRPMVVPIRQGDAVVFAVHHRPVAGKRGVYRANLRHGVSRVHSGQRYTLGIIFHDAA